MPCLQISMKLCAKVLVYLRIIEKIRRVITKSGGKGRKKSQQFSVR